MEEMYESGGSKRSAPGIYEILRTIDAMQLTDKANVATPVDWEVGGECMVLPTVKDHQLDMFPKGVKVVPMPSGKNYLRKTPCPEV